MYLFNIISKVCRNGLLKNSRRPLFASLSSSNKKIDIPYDDDNQIIEKDEDYNNLVEKYLSSSVDHSCFIIHPYVKWGPKKLQDTLPTRQMDEAVALIRTLGSWKVVDQTSIPLDNLEKKTLFGTGTLSKLQEKIRRDPRITAVFINMGMLRNKQLEELEKMFGVPILDRYKIVMQILRLHAVSKHAKLQVALAELPYLRSRLRKHESEFQAARNYDTRRLMLQNREQQLKDSIKKLRSQRELLRNRRKKIDYPIVAIVGYTNAGKTSLIKALTNDKKLQPRDQLFATLDVTVHAGILPSNLEILYVDTVGFISDIPTGLIECFVVTLEDVMFADVIVHVEDLSSEDIIHQRKHVLATLEQLAERTGVQNILKKIITVGNKCDVRNDPNESVLQVSAKTTTGIDVLRQKIEEEVIKNTNRLVLNIRIPTGGDEIRWFYKNAAVSRVSEDPTDNNPDVAAAKRQELKMSQNSPMKLHPILSTVEYVIDTDDEMEDAITDESKMQSKVDEPTTNSPMKLHPRLSTVKYLIDTDDEMEDAITDESKMQSKVDKPTTNSPMELHPRLSTVNYVIDTDDEIEDAVTEESKMQSKVNKPTTNDPPLLTFEDLQQMKAEAEEAMKLIATLQTSEIGELPDISELRDNNEDNNEDFIYLDCYHLTMDQIEQAFNDNIDYLFNEVDFEKKLGWDKKSFRLKIQGSYFYASLALFNKEQKSVLASLLRKTFGAIERYYYQKLLPVICLKIFMDEFQMSEEEANEYLHNRPGDKVIF